MNIFKNCEIEKMKITGIYNSKYREYDIKKIENNKYLLNLKNNDRKILINREVNMTFIEALFIEIINHMSNKKITTEMK